MARAANAANVARVANAANGGPRGDKGDRGETGTVSKIVSQKIEGYSLVVLRGDRSLEIFDLKPMFQKHHYEVQTMLEQYFNEVQSG